MSGFRYGRYRLAGRDFATIGAAIQACESYAAKVRRHWGANLLGIVAAGQPGDGATIILARAVGQPDGSVAFLDLEPAEPGEE